MKTRYVLNEDEYLSICNKLEKLDGDIGKIYSLLSNDENDYEDALEQIIHVSRGFRKMMVELGWSERI